MARAPDRCCSPTAAWASNTERTSRKLPGGAQDRSLGYPPGAVRKAPTARTCGNSGSRWPHQAESAITQSSSPLGTVGYRVISVRTAYSSGKKVRSRASRRKGTPLDPPVPRLNPIVRSTVLRCRKRQNWKFSSRSTSSSQAS